MKKLLLIGLLLSVGFSQKEYNIDHIVERDYIYIKKFSYEIVNGKVYKMYGDMKAPLGYIIGGMKEGTWIDWHETGLKFEEGSYKNGKRDGLWTYWYENGQKEKENTYKDGELISQKKWNEDGSVKK